MSATTTAPALLTLGWDVIETTSSGEQFRVAAAAEEADAKRIAATLQRASKVGWTYRVEPVERDGAVQL